MSLQEKIGLDCLTLDPAIILAKSEPEAANFCFDYCADVLRATGILSSRLFVVTNYSLFIADLGSILNSELGIRAGEEIVEELSCDSSVLGLAVVHALGFNIVSGEYYFVLADRSGLFEKSNFLLLTHFEWKHGHGAGIRADYIIEDGKAKFVLGAKHVTPTRRYLFLGGLHEYVH